MRFSTKYFSTNNNIKINAKMREIRHSTLLWKAANDMCIIISIFLNKFFLSKKEMRTTTCDEYVMENTKLKCKEWEGRRVKEESEVSNRKRSTYEIKYHNVCNSLDIEIYNNFKIQVHKKNVCKLWQPIQVYRKPKLSISIRNEKLTLDFGMKIKLSVES